MRIYYIYITIIFLLFSAELSSSHYDCPVKRCTENGPAIRFPFRLKSHQAHHCGYPGFDLHCSQTNETILELPYSPKTSINNTNLPLSIKFSVLEINYVSQFITLSNTHNCLPKLLQNLNLSSWPFTLKGSYDYTFFSCPSTRELDKSGFISVPCLSSSSYVYAVNTYDSFYQPKEPLYGSAFDSMFATVSYFEPVYVKPLSSCRKMFKISSSKGIFSQNSEIQLSWAKPACAHCEIKGNYCRLRDKGRTNDTFCFSRLLYQAYMQTSDRTERGSQKELIVAGVVLLFTLGVSIAIVTQQIYRSKALKKEDEVKIEQFLEEYKALKPTRYSYVDLKRITSNFNEKLGQGGYGTVYKGKLSDDVFVAVKVLNSSNENGEDFINEVGTIGKIHHVNVVRLVGYCVEESRQALVYEFLPNESLGKLVSSETRNPLLSWEKMQHIAIGIARGLEYLHQGCEQRILHFDIKPQNILLDNDFNPKVSDFGLAKLCSKEQSVVSMTAARGTMGYIAPEVFSRNFGNVSHKSDVYSFGMLLLETVGGRNNSGLGPEDTSQQYFPQWIYNKLNQGEEVTVQIERAGDTKILRKLTVVGLWCIQWHPVDRPSMKRVVQMLEADEIPSMPENQFGSRDRTTAEASTHRRMFSSNLEIISESN